MTTEQYFDQMIAWCEESTQNLINKFELKPGFPIEELYEKLGIKLERVKDFYAGIGVEFGFSYENNEWTLYYQGRDNNKTYERYVLARALANVFLYSNFDVTQMRKLKTYHDKNLYIGKRQEPDNIMRVNPISERLEDIYAGALLMPKYDFMRFMAQNSVNGEVEVDLICQEFDVSSPSVITRHKILKRNF